MHILFGDRYRVFQCILLHCNYIIVFTLTDCYLTTLLEFINLSIECGALVNCGPFQKSVIHVHSTPYNYAGLLE